ncbi:MAG: hypothetical protein NC821_06595 [Candidatus Omnitrophica bacterium]|nr:hypothetical protein [Candidatus Omnitrophota bacterium]
MVRKCGTKKKAEKKARYICEVCGLAITVDNVCSCVDVCDIICCGQEMKPKK